MQAARRGAAAPSSRTSRTLGGSPRAIHELVRLLLESDVIVREGILWRVDAEKLAAMTLPKTYEELVAARLRVMDATERRVLEMAAVVGETSWLDAILALERSNQRVDDPDGPTLAQIAASGDHSRLAVVAAIGKLVEREWLVEVPQSSVSGERELRFAYPNLWSIVYKGIDEARRRGYHAVVARWLELHPEGRAPAAQEEVARHLALAGDAARGRAALSPRRRGRARAVRERARDPAVRSRPRLHRRARTDLAARIHLWHDLGSVYELIGDFEAALGAFERMLRLSWVAASKTKAAVAFNKMGRVWRRKGDLKLALEYLERGLELFRGASDARGIAGSLDDIGKSLQMLGRYDEAHAKITEALARRGKRGDKRAIATSLSRLGDVQQDRGQYESAYNCHQEALELRKAAGDRWGCVVSQNNLAALAFELGDLAEARAGWLAALPEAEAIGALPLVRADPDEPRRARARRGQARRGAQPARERARDHRGHRGSRPRERVLPSPRARSRSCRARPPAARELAERALAGREEGRPAREGGPGVPDARRRAVDEPLRRRRRAPARPTAAAVAFGKAIEVLRSIGNEAALGKALFAFGRYKAEIGEIADGQGHAARRDHAVQQARAGPTCRRGGEAAARSHDARPPPRVLDAASCDTSCTSVL